MAYQSKAYGSLVLDLGVDDAKVRKSLQMFRKDIRNATNDMKYNVKAAKEMGESETALSAKIDGIQEVIRRQKALIQQYTEALKHSTGATKQEIDAAKQQIETLKQSVSINERLVNKAQVARDAQVGALQDINRKQEEANALRKAGIDLMDAEGKKFGVIEQKIKDYGTSIDEVNEKLQLVHKGMRGLEKDGLTNSAEYQQHLLEEKQYLKERVDLQTAADAAIAQKSVDYAKARRQNLGVDDSYESLKRNYTAEKASGDILKATGDSGAYQEYMSGVRQRHMSALQAQIALEEQSMTKSIEGTQLGTDITSRIAKMKTELSSLDDTQRRYTEGLTDLNWSNQKQIATMNTLSKVYEANGQKFKAQIIQGQSLRQEVSMLTDQYSRERTELTALGEKYGTQSRQYIDQSRKVSDLALQTANLNKRIIALNRSSNGAYGAFQKFADYAEQHKSTFNAVGTSMQTASRGMLTFGAGVGLAVAQGVKLNNQLDQTNNYTKALLQNAGREDPSEVVKNLAKAKKEDIVLSQQYGISQNDIAKAQQTLAHRGYESNQVLAASKPLLQSAIATGYSLSDVTNIATSAVEAFGMRSKNTAKMTRNTTKAINTMSYASDLSASSFNDTGVALSYVGATAKAAGMSMDQTAAAVGELSLNGIGAQKAGTGLRKILQSLISPTSNGAKVIKQLGVSFEDSHGKLKPFNEIIEELHDKMQGMSKVQQVDMLKKLFGTTGETAAAALINNADALSKFNVEVAKADKTDYVGRLSKQNLNNPITQINRLKQAWNEMTMQMASSFKPFVTGSIKELADFIEKINSAGPVVHGFINAFAIGIPTVGALLFLVGSFLKHINSLTTNWSAFKALFSKDARDNTKAAQSMNDALIEQLEIMRKLNTEVAENNELNGVANNKINTNGTGNGSSSGNGLNLSKEEKVASDVEKDAKVSRWTRFKSRFGGIGSTGTRFGKVGTELETAGTVAEDAGKLGRFAKLGKFAGYGLKGVAGLDIATSLLDLLGTNRRNVGNHVGGATGSIAGTIIGGGLGTLIPIPGVGTALGAALGGWAGDSLGRAAGQGVQGWFGRGKTPKTSKADNRIIQVTTKLDNASFEQALAKSATGEDKTNYSNSSNSQYNSIISELKADKKKNNKTAESDTKVLNDFLKSQGKAGLSSDTTDKEKKSLNGKYDTALSDVKNLKNGKAGKNRLEAVQKTNQAILDAEAQSSAQQVEIQAKLSATKGKISDKEAGQLIATAEKVRKAQVSEANKSYEKSKKKANDKYNSVITAAYRERQAGTISQQTYDSIIKKAGEARDNAIGAAEQTKQGQIDKANKAKEGVVSAARKQTKDHLASVNEETGSSLNLFQQWEKGVSQIFSDVGKWFASTGLGKWFKQHKTASKYAGRAGKSTINTGLNAVVSGAGSVANMFGFAEGSDAIQGTQQALVNEKGMESAYNPKTNKIRFFNGGPQVTTLFDGERILNAQDTFKLTHGGLGQNQTLNGYADGTGTFSFGSGSVRLKNIKSLNNFKKHSKNVWKTIHDDTKEKVDKTHDNTIKQLSDMKKVSLAQMQGIHDGTISSTKDLVSNYNSIFGQLPGMTQTSVKGSIDQLNRGFSGINATLNQFGSKKNVLNPIHYAAGSGGAVAREHDAIVNDAMTGNQQEAIVRNDGIFLPKYRNALVHLNAGDAVLNGSQTRAYLNGTGVAHYASGSGVDDTKLKELIANGLKNSPAQYNKDFTGKIGKVGSTLGQGFLGDSQGALSNQMIPWYNAIFQVLNDASGNGTSASAFLKYAKENFTGDKYQLGANGPSLYDCSSMIEAALKHFGIQLGRTTTAMQSSSQLTRLGSDIDSARAGDLVLFGHGDGAAGHVGIVNNPATGTMFNETPPAAGITNINDVTSVPLDGYYRINAFANKGLTKSPYFNLAKSQLGKQRLAWVAKHLGPDGDFNGVIPTGDHAYMLKKAGISQSDWADYNYIISHESGWNPTATNPNGGAYGLPQSLPADKMASAGSDWRTNPITQLRWMKGYINGRYGSADNARAYWQAHHNYENGGLITNEQIARVGEHNKPEMIIPLTDKFRTVQLAKQAVDFVTASDRNALRGGGSDDVKELKEQMKSLNGDLNKMVKLLEILAANSSSPVKAYITDKDLFKTINNRQQKVNMQNALRRGESLV